MGLRTFRPEIIRRRMEFVRPLEEGVPGLRASLLEELGEMAVLPLIQKISHPFDYFSYVRKLKRGIRGAENALAVARGDQKHGSNFVREVETAGLLVTEPEPDQTLSTPNFQKQ